MNLRDQTTKTLVEQTLDNLISNECKAKFVDGQDIKNGRHDVLRTVKEIGTLAHYGVGICEQNYLAKNSVVQGVIIKRFLDYKSARRVLESPKLLTRQELKELITGLIND